MGLSHGEDSQNEPYHIPFATCGLFMFM